MSNRRFLAEVSSSEMSTRGHARSIVDRNLEIVRASEVARRKEGIFAFEKPEAFFTFDGSLRVGRLGPSVYRDFFAEIGRSVRERGETVLRGQRYLCALDTTIAFPHKIEILKKDFHDALDVLLKDRQSNGTKDHFKLRLGAMDYVKNTAVTFFNALVCPEKYGYFNLNDQEYQTVRGLAIRLARLATNVQYAYLLGDEKEAQSSLHLLNATRSDVERVAVYLNYYAKNPIEEGGERGRSTFYRPILTRPELAHPLLIGAAAIKTTERLKDNPPDTIIGLATGSTEYAFALEYAFRKLNGVQNLRMIMAPISLNMTRMNLESEEDVLNYASAIASGQAGGELAAFLKESQSALSDKSVLLADDNTATGKTLQLTADILDFLCGPKEVDASVAEVDVIRLELHANKLKRHQKELRQITSTADTTQDVVNILPISQELQSNTDLRKIFEFRRVWHFYEHKQAPVTLSGTVLRNVMRRAILSSPKQDFQRDPRRNEGIYSFEGDNAFLSNFESVPISYSVPPTTRRGRSRGPTTYPSVEHAFQATKFPIETARAIPQEALAQLNHYMSERYDKKWQPINTPEELVAAFANPEYPAGQIKIIADRLRDAGYVRKDWFSLRLSVMVDLLVEKFKDPVLKEKLLATGNRLLVEGNTWWDSYWGIAVQPGKGINMGPNVVQQGYGSNMLGLILMELRAQLQEGAS